jgi:ElaB/YqjD/DUF883 family membrane-anchored ribosome-binding protein
MATKAPSEGQTPESASSSATSQLRDQTETVREDIRKLGRIAKDVAHEKVDEARQTATEYYGQGREKAGELEDQLVTYIREKPIKSMLIAAGIGAFFGFFWSRH